MRTNATHSKIMSKMLTTRMLAMAVLVVLLALLGQAQLDAQQGYKVIVNENNQVSSLDKKQVSKFLLKKALRWEDGTAVDPVDLAPSSAVREAFSEDVHGRSVASIKNYWQRQIFSGANTPPAEVGSDAEVIAYVRSNPGAIGYVSTGAPLDGVKAVSVN